MKICFSVILLVLILECACFSDQIHNPHNLSYKYGIKPSVSQKTMDLNAQNAFADWLSRYVTSEGAPKGTFRVLMGSAYDNATVSEGIGWGMFITVLMESKGNNTQKYFDGLWKFYLHYKNKYGLMSWKIDKNGKALFSESATEADQNAAISLVYADKLWGSKGEINYLGDASELINNIRLYEIDRQNGILKPGVNWGGTDNTNPAYYSPSYYRAWGKYSNEWTNLLNKSYQLYDIFYNKFNYGLYPDWCDSTGNRTNLSYDFTYDACQVPLKIGMDYLLHGTGERYLSKISSWFAQKTNNDPSAIVDGYKLDGTTIGKYHNASFVGPLTVAAMASKSKQDWLDKCYTNLSNMPTGGSWGYYSDTLRVVSLIIISGNLLEP